MPVAIDTLKATQRLKAAGFSDNQTKSLVATFAWGITERAYAFCSDPISIL